MFSLEKTLVLMFKMKTKFKDILADVSIIVYLFSLFISTLMQGVWDMNYGVYLIFH